MTRALKVRPPRTTLGTDSPSGWTLSKQWLPSSQPLKNLLAHRDLLTKELENLSGTVVSVKLQQRLETQQGDQLRRVIIRCGTKPIIYAETLIPASTLARHSWLADLGDQPLGARMCQNGNVTRSEYQFRRLTASDRIYQRAVVHADLDSDVCLPLWGRRYCLSLGSCDVQVTEVFLPAVSCLQ